VLGVGQERLASYFLILLVLGPLNILYVPYD
jgi:hypothetical protein